MDQTSVETVRVAIDVPNQPRYREVVVFPLSEYHELRRESRPGDDGKHMMATPLSAWQSLATVLPGNPSAITRDSAGEARVWVPMSVLMAAITELRRYARYLAAHSYTMAAAGARDVVGQLEGSFIAATEPPKEETPDED